MATGTSRKGGCFIFGGWSLLVSAVFVLLVFGAVVTLYQLGIWDEFWDSVLKR